MRVRSSRGGRVPPPAPLLVVPGRELCSSAGWPEIFGRRAPLVVEVGFGRDTFLLEQAEEHAGRDHVGIERDPHRVSVFLERAQERGLTNVRALPVGAELALGLCFPDASVREVHAYFPDPWPKARHARNRLVRPWFPREVRRILAPGGTLHLATDDVPYRDQIVDVLDAGGFEDVLGSGWAPEAPLGHETTFERLWRRRGRDIHHMIYRVRERAVAAPSG